MKFEWKWINKGQEWFTGDPDGNHAAVFRDGNGWANHVSTSREISGDCFDTMQEAMEHSEQELRKRT